MKHKCVHAIVFLFISITGSLCINVSAQETTISIWEALDQGHIEVTITSTGSASGYIANLTINSLLYVTNTLDVERSGMKGMVIVNPSDEEQDQIILHIPGVSLGSNRYEPTDSVTIAPGESVSLMVTGYCININRENPTEGAELGLAYASEKTDVEHLIGVIETLEKTRFPEDMENLVILKQIIIWMSQAENLDKTSKYYAEKGYPIEEPYIPLIKEVLDESGVDTDRIVALSSEARPGGGFTWVPVLVPVTIGVVVVFYFLRLRKPGTGIMKPPSGRGEDMLSPLPEGEEGAPPVKDPCELLLKILEDKREALSHLTVPIGDPDNVVKKNLEEIARLEKQYTECLSNNCRYDLLQTICERKIKELDGRGPPTESALREVEEKIRIQYVLIDNYEKNIGLKGMKEKRDDAQKELEKIKKRRDLIEEIFDLESKIKSCQKKRDEKERVEQARALEQAKAREDCEREKQECLKEIEKRINEIVDMRLNASQELDDLAEKITRINGVELWDNWHKSLYRLKIQVARFEPVLKLAGLNVEDYKGLWDWGGWIGTVVGYYAEEAAKMAIPTSYIDLVAGAYGAIGGFFDPDKHEATNSIIGKYPGEAVDIINGAKGLPEVLKNAKKAYDHNLKTFRKLEDNIYDLFSKRKKCMYNLPKYPSDVDLGICIKGCRAALDKLRREKEELKEKIEECKAKTRTLEGDLKEAEKKKRGIISSSRSMDKTAVYIEKYRRGVRDRIKGPFEPASKWKKRWEQIFGTGSDLIKR